MSRPMTVSERIVIAADPQVVYAAVADPTQTGRWSPENLGATVDSGASGALEEGATFVGRNRRGWMRWCTGCRVLTARPGETFEFRVEYFGLWKPMLHVPIATWRYDLEAVDGGTAVTETWHDDRASMSDRTARIFDKAVTRSTFAEFNTRNIHTTLQQLKAALEN